jgi:hypothetical protein
MKGVCAIYNNKALALVTRSGSHALMSLMLPNLYEQRIPSGSKEDRWHPIMNLQGWDIRNGLPNYEICCMVRNPIERFRSSCARRNKTVEEGLLEDEVHFWSIESMGLLNDKIKYFLFPEQIDECAAWLGLPIPVPRLNEEKDDKKPVLSESQLGLVVKQYYNDNELYKKLKKSYYDRKDIICQI